MQLFKEGVYKKLEEKLKEANEIEIALKMINADKRLQKFIQGYAVKNGVKSEGYGEYTLGSKRAEIELWKDKTEYSNLLYLGIDAKREIAPIYVRTWSIDCEWGGKVYNNCLIEEEREGFYVDSKNPKEMRKRLIHASLLPDNLSAKQIFGNLEKSILNLGEQNEA